MVVLVHENTTYMATWERGGAVVMPMPASEEEKDVSTQTRAGDGDLATKEEAAVMMTKLYM